MVLQWPMSLLMILDAKSFISASASKLVNRYGVLFSLMQMQIDYVSKQIFSFEKNVYDTLEDS